ncbi:MAG: hypothetical protein SO136_08315 [Sarcina ventriculi]|nr:hypothetical protein [Sarcina ventriculi]
MKKIRENLRKDQIAECKGYMRWYRVIDGELRLFINEKALNEHGEKLNNVYYTKNIAYLCVDGIDYCNKFHERFKDLPVRVYIKSDGGSLYNEYEVKSFGICDKGLEVIFA